MFTYSTNSGYWMLTYLARAIASSLSLTDLAYNKGYARGYASANYFNLSHKELDTYFGLLENVTQQRAEQLIVSEFKQQKG